MKYVVKSKRISLIVSIICVLLLQGCSLINSDNNAEEPLAKITLFSEESSENATSLPLGSADEHEHLSVAINQTEHSFNILCESTDKDIYMEGTMLTYDCPDKANIYKIIPYDTDQDPFYSPINEWQSVLFQPRLLVMGRSKYDEDTKTKYRLSRAERNSVIDSFTRINISELKREDAIITAFPEVTLNDYVLKYTYPAITTDLYELTTFDTIHNKDVTVDIIEERSFDYFVLRRSINGINVGLPFSVDMHYENYDDNRKIETRILSEECKTYYDGVDIYEVHTNDKANKKDLEVYLKDQTVLSFEQAFNKASDSLYEILADSVSEGKDTKVYAAELVYLTIQVSDMSNVNYYTDHIVRDSYEAYLCPFWVIYIHSNYFSVGEDIAKHQPLLINAITGEVVMCN